MHRAPAFVLLASLSALAAPPDAGSPDAGDPGSWTLSQRLAPGSAAYLALVADLVAPLPTDGGAVGEAPLSQAEAEALLQDPRAQAVYGEKTVSIVAPSMVARHRQEHLDLMALFLKPERLDAARAFAKTYEATLAATQARTGVDPYVILGILTWESKLGTITGDFHAFNVFTSQTFFIDEANAVALSRKGEKVALDAAKQQRRVETIRERARRNLLALARQCKARGIDTVGVKGSWAGALGFPQFMPASLRWADDGNGDGVIDLFQMDDAIASVGRYLAEHGYAASPQKAVWDYNHEDAYVQGVLAFARALREGGPDAGKPAKRGKGRSVLPARGSGAAPRAQPHASGGAAVVPHRAHDRRVTP